MKTIFSLAIFMLMSMNASSFACHTCTQGSDTTENKKPHYVPTEIDKAIVISVDGKTMTGVEYIKEYVTKCTYIPETQKFVIHKCNQEKRDDAKVTTKGHHNRRDGHGGRKESDNDFRHRPVQWLRCDTCGMYLRGYTEGARHSQCTNHTHFQRIDVQ